MGRRRKKRLIGFDSGIGSLKRKPFRDSTLGLVQRKKVLKPTTESFFFWLHRPGRYVGALALRIIRKSSNRTNFRTLSYSICGSVLVREIKIIRKGHKESAKARLIILPCFENPNRKSKFNGYRNPLQNSWSY